MKNSKIEELLANIDGVSEKLIEQLKKLCAVFARTYKKYNDSLTSDEDIKSECLVSVLKHKDKFDPVRSKSIEIFLYSQVLNDLKSYIRKAKYRITCTAYDAIHYPLEVKQANREIHDVYLHAETLEAPVEEMLSLDFGQPMLTKLTPEELQLLSSRFIENATYAQIAEDLGISTSGAYYNVKKVINRLKYGAVK